MITTKTDRKLVLEKYSNAFVYDEDGEKVQIKLRETETRACPNCNQEWTRDKDRELMQTIASSGSEEGAWKEAVRNLGLG